MFWLLLLCGGVIGTFGGKSLAILLLDRRENRAHVAIAGVMFFCLGALVAEGCRCF